MWSKVEEGEVARYGDTAYGDVVRKMMAITSQLGEEGMPVERVSRTVRKALEDPKPRSRYILANNWLAGWIVPRWLPDRWFDRIVGKQLGLKLSK